MMNINECLMRSALKAAEDLISTYNLRLETPELRLRIDRIREDLKYALEVYED